MNSTTKSVELAVRTQNALAEFGHRLAARMQQERGQTAAEYLGIVVIVAAIIAAIVSTKLDKTIAEALEGAVKSISGGK